MTTMIDTSTSPDVAVRALHGTLTQLGLSSPFGAALKLLDAAEVLGIGQANQRELARRTRHEIALAVARGARPLDEETVTEYERTRRWFTGDDDHLSPADVLVAHVVTLARQDCGQLIYRHAGEVFGTLRTEVDRIVAELRALPPAPRGLWSHVDPARALARVAGHEMTYSRVALLTDRFWTCQRGARHVRGPAGHGPEKLDDGAPRSALIYRNWQKLIETEGDDRVSVRRDLKLWHAATDGDLDPGLWLPEEVKIRVSTFADKLRWLGSAVSGGVAHG